MSHWRCCCGAQPDPGPTGVTYPVCPASFSPGLSSNPTETDNLDGLVQIVEWEGVGSGQYAIDYEPSPPADFLSSGGRQQRGISGTYLFSGVPTQSDLDAARAYIASAFNFPLGQVSFSSTALIYTTASCQIYAGEFSAVVSTDTGNINPRPRAECNAQITGPFRRNIILTAAPATNCHVERIPFQSGGTTGYDDYDESVVSSKLGVVFDARREFFRTNSGQSQTEVRTWLCELDLTPTLYPWAPTDAPGLSAQCRSELPSAEVLRAALGYSVAAPLSLRLAVDPRAAEAASRPEFRGGCCD